MEIAAAFGLLLLCLVGLGLPWLLLRWLLSLKVREDRARVEPRCVSCGYPVRGSVSEACPECGRPRADGGVVEAPPATMGRRLVWFAAPVLVLGSVLIIVVAFAAFIWFLIWVVEVLY